MGPLPPSLLSWLTNSTLVLLSGGSGEALGELGDGRQAQVFLRALALVHHVQDVIHKAVQADKGRHLAGAADGGEELGGGLFTYVRRLS